MPVSSPSVGEGSGFAMFTVVGLRAAHDRIDMVRSDWEAQMSRARELLLAWMSRARALV